MCRGKKHCTELDPNPKLWDKNSPLIPPKWFNDELRDWYCEHGQMSGRFRNEELKIETEKKNISLDPLRNPNKYQKEVFQRDHYTCQYCGIRVIPKEILITYSEFVGINLMGKTNNERHGIVLAFRANADHVIPWTHGGRTNLENLVTSCWSCNFGKTGYTLEEIGINDP